MRDDIHMRGLRRRGVLAGAAAAVPAALAPARARAQPAPLPVRLSHGYGIHFLPLMVVRDRRLLEQHARALGLPPLAVDWRVLDGGSAINDAMISGALDIAGTGAPGFITLWSKARRSSSSVVGVCALGNGAQWLNSNRPAVRSLRDLGPGDKIAVPQIKTSYSAIVLQMAAAKEFGIDRYNALDPITVGLPHPEAVATLTSGKTEITAHMSSPPFSHQETEARGVHRVLSTADVLGPITIDVVYATSRFATAQPKVIDALLAAMEEAVRLIATDRAAAVESYGRMSAVKAKPEAVAALLADPETSFTVEPKGIMQYVQFLAHTGQIKDPPAAWTDMFVPQMAGRAGS
jgi:NitT/TauT family transport system substrate-binding protein